MNIYFYFFGNGGGHSFLRNLWKLSKILHRSIDTICEKYNITELGVLFNFAPLRRVGQKQDISLYICHDQIQYRFAQPSGLSPESEESQLLSTLLSNRVVEHLKFESLCVLNPVSGGYRQAHRANKEIRIFHRASQKINIIHRTIKNQI